MSEQVNCKCSFFEIAKYLTGREHKENKNTSFALDSLIRVLQEQCVSTDDLIERSGLIK